MQKLIALRFAVPTVVIMAVVTVAIIAVAAVTGAHPGTAWGAP